MPQIDFTEEEAEELKEAVEGQLMLLDDKEDKDEIKLLNGILVKLG